MDSSTRLAVPALQDLYLLRFVSGQTDHSEFQCGNCLLAEDYRLEEASLITLVASLRKKLGKTQSRMFTFSILVAERRFESIINPQEE